MFSDHRASYRLFSLNCGNSFQTLDPFYFYGNLLYSSKFILNALVKYTSCVVNKV